MKINGWTVYWVTLLIINGLAFIVSGVFLDIMGLLITSGMIFFCSSALYTHLEQLEKK